MFDPALVIPSAPPEIVVPEAVLADDFTRIFALPRRPPLNCERDLVSKLYAPETQALIDFMTEQYSRGERVCACGLSQKYIAAGISMEEGWYKFVKESGNPFEMKQDDFFAIWGHPCINKFKAEQAWALYEAPKAGGIHGFLSVGAGKTLIFILMALAFPNCRTALLLAKPTQRIHYRLNYIRLREHFKVPSIVFDDATEGFWIKGQPVVHFFPYSRLSRPESTAYFDSLDFDTVLADESHCIARPSSRTNRVKTFFAEKNARLADGSGTLIKKGICDTFHLAAFSLGTGSPQPLNPEVAAALGAVVDPSFTPDRSSEVAMLLQRKFAPEAKRPDLAYPIAQVREGLRIRLIETLGVISTRAHSVDCSLSMMIRPAPPIPVEIELALNDARAAKRPDGEVLVEAPIVARCVREVACGFHSYWAYPKGEPLELRARWFEARKCYFRELRSVLENPVQYLDSPHLCYQAAMRAWSKPAYDGPLPTWKSETWQAWHAIKNQVDPDPRTAWLKDAAGNIVGEYLARDAAAWALEHRGIVWCKSVAFGQKIAQIAKIPYHGGGPEAERRIMAEKGKTSIVVSIPAHGESRDGLQRIFSKQLVTELPASGDGWEQLLGRLLREGQKEDTVETWIYRHVPEYRDDFKQAVMLAEFIEQTTLNRQWLNVADKDFKL